MARIPWLLATLLLLAACAPGGSSPQPSHYHFHAGQQFSAQWHQTISGDSSGQPLAADFSAREDFTVSSVDASGNTTFAVTPSNFSGTDASASQVGAPTAFSFTIDPRGAVTAGNAWPLLGTAATLPAADQFCVPLPKAPLAAGLAWQAPLGHGSAGSYAASADTVIPGYPATLDATSHAALDFPPSTQGGITTQSKGSMDQALSCVFSLDKSTPQSLASNVSLRLTTIISLGGTDQGNQTVVTTASITTTVAYSF